MPATLAAILTARLAGEFVFRMNARRRHFAGVALHAAAVALASGLLLGVFAWPILLAVLLAHFVTDGIKLYRPADTLRPFLAEQAAHLAVLLGLAWYFPDAALAGWWSVHLSRVASDWYFASLSCVSGVILCVPAGGVLIARMIRRFTDEIQEADLSGLTDGGRYIGWLERILVMLLLLAGQPNGIGFLIAAKSILRFGEIKDARQRRVAEYVIIGTFLSFGWALLISLLTQKAIQHWIP